MSDAALLALIGAIGLSMPVLAYRLLKLFGRRTKVTKKKQTVPSDQARLKGGGTRRDL